MTNWTLSQNITTFHLRLAINKEPTAEMDESDVVKALELILKPANWPILIHCNKGKYRVGVSWVGKEVAGLEPYEYF